ncbi:MAG: phosphotransferase, partial [Candidatus Woesearchaeota archaeon]
SELKILLHKMEAAPKVFGDITPRFSHSDYKLNNLLVQDNRLSGVLDFEHAASSDRDFDIHYFMQDLFDKQLPKDKASVFLYAYNQNNKNNPLSEEFYAKADFFRCWATFQKVVALRPTLRNASIDIHPKIRANLEKHLSNFINGKDEYKQYIV